MAAAEYFSNTPMAQTGASPHLGPTSHPHYTQSTPQIYTHQSSPPPYQESRPGVHFAPTPTELQQRHSFSTQQRPSFSSSQNSWGSPPQQMHKPPHPQYNPATQRLPQYYGSSSAVGYGTHYQQPQQLNPHVRPYANPNSSQFMLQEGGYSSDPEPDRRKYKQRRRRDSGETRSPKPKSRSTNADAFLGAAGGGLIGDLIFPGLGTVGGAAIGWLSGKDYGHHRKGREERRSSEQKEWEQKFRPGKHHRSRSRTNSSRGSSTQLGEMDRR